MSYLGLGLLRFEHGLNALLVFPPKIKPILLQTRGSLQPTLHKNKCMVYRFETSKIIAGVSKASCVHRLHRKVSFIIVIAYGTCKVINLFLHQGIDR